MKIVIQKVSSAFVEVSGRPKQSIGKGYCILVGFKAGDSENDVDILIEKIRYAKLFPLGEVRFAHSIIEEDAEILLIPQYTLYGDIYTKHKPSFTYAMKPGYALLLFELFCTKIKAKGIKLKVGSFGEFMRVTIVNEGPVTFIVESNA
jgi:D-tyrosyl-tRNA(Tyr) deacylase